MKVSCRDLRRHQSLREPWAWEVFELAPNPQFDNTQIPIPQICVPPTQRHFYPTKRARFEMFTEQTYVLGVSHQQSHGEVRLVWTQSIWLQMVKTDCLYVSASNDSQMAVNWNHAQYSIIADWRSNFVSLQNRQRTKRKFKEQSILCVRLNTLNIFLLVECPMDIAHILQCIGGVLKRQNLWISLISPIHLVVLVKKEEKLNQTLSEGQF